MKIILDRTTQYQTFNGFGASGAWWAQEVGGWTHTDEKSGLPARDAISRLLYGKEEGIGLAIYRYNLGGGSVESGRGSFSQPLRRAESFDAGDGKYDWSKDKNAVYMMNRAVADGACEVIMFVNSPIERLTKNHMAHTDKNKAWRENLPRKNYPAFAKYCLDCAEHFIEQGVPVKYLSPVNEPLWVWTGGQEGCHYRAASVRRVFSVFASQLSQRPRLSGLRLSGAENGDIRWFNKSYTGAVLRDKETRKYLDGIDLHSYCLPVPSFLPFKAFLNNRAAFIKRYRKWLDRHYPDLPVIMSEWTHMQGGRDKTMASALVMARVIYEDIALLGVSSWQHWIAVSEVDYCDGLIYINLEDKTFETTKRLYATGNFSKYIPLGARRISACCEDGELDVLAFSKGNKTVVVIVNPTKSSKAVSLDIPKGAHALLAVTDRNNDLAEKELESGADIEIPAESVNTVVITADKQKEEQPCKQ